MNHLIAMAIRNALGRGPGCSPIIASVDELELIDREGVAGLVAEIVDPEHSLGRLLGRRRLEIFAQAARTIDVIDELGLSLSGSGIRATVLKGGALLSSVYRDHLGWRPLSDLDLLVRREDLAKVHEVLHDMGLRQQKTRFRGNGFEIDLHTHIGRSELLGRARSAYRFPRQPQTVPLPIGGPAMRRLEPELELCHLAAHAVKHAFGRWIWLVDILFSMPSSDPEMLLETAIETGADRALGYCRYLGCEYLGIGGWPLELPAPGGLERRWLDHVASRRGPAGLGRLMAGLAIPRTLERAGYWLEVVFGGLERDPADAREKVSVVLGLLRGR